MLCDGAEEFIVIKGFFLFREPQHDAESAHIGDDFAREIRAVVVMVVIAVDGIGVVVGDFSDFALEGGFVIGGPPIVLLAVFVVARSAGVEAMADFVADDHANVAVELFFG